MEFIEEEIDIKYEYDTGDDIDFDHDLGSSSHSTDWKLNPTVDFSSGEGTLSLKSLIPVELNDGMEFVEDEIDIKYEYGTVDDIDLDHDLGSSSHSTDWKLNVESRVMLERMKSLDSEKEFQGNLEENDGAETQTGSGQNQFKCDVCRKGFHNPSNLIRHKRTHTREKPYKCDVCGQCFVQSGTLTRHKLTHTGEKPHRCDLCEKRFRDRSHLTTHKLFHTGEKPYKCDVCGTCFTRNGALTQHKLIHTGEKPHKCEQCGKCFSRNSYLTVHARTHRI